MKRDDQRCGNTIHQFQDHIARQAAEEAELVLQPYNFGTARLDLPRRLDKATGVTLGYDAANNGVEYRGNGGRRHRIDVDGNLRRGHCKRRVDIGGEGRDAAAPRKETTDQCDPGSIRSFWPKRLARLQTFIERSTVKRFVHRHTFQKMMRQKASPSILSFVSKPAVGLGASENRTAQRRICSNWPTPREKHRRPIPVMLARRQRPALISGMRR
ncbi:MAG TPA: hypothetical protein VEZ59_06875 [Sphingopyxis sp.]|nr:hypothetical protein [Sphingopyxis sp.]